MERFLNITKDLSRFINRVAGVSLALSMLLTTADVILRGFRKLIVGTYELVGFAGAIIIGFSIPFTSWVRGHIYVDFLISKFPQKVRNIFNVATRCMGIGLFFLIGWNLIKLAMALQKAGDVSPTLTLHFYPFAHALGIVCFIQCLVLLCDILKIFGGKYE